MSSRLPNPPSLVEHKGLSFLIFDAPNDSNLDLYIEEFQKKKVKTVVRVCEATYSPKPLKDNGIDMMDWPFPDGAGPPTEIVHNWMDLVRKHFKESKTPIGVHCLAGLGRAPVLVALALIEFGMEPLAAVEFIRKVRRGSINAPQLKYILAYKKSKKGGCIVM